MEQQQTAEETRPPRQATACVCMGAGPMLSELLKRLGPDESVRQHFRNARIEVLKGLREMLDRRIAELSKPVQPKGAKVVVE